MKQFEAAVEICNKAISLKPDYAEAYNNRGNALLEMTQLEAALDRKMPPDFLAAAKTLGITEAELKAALGAP